MFFFRGGGGISLFQSNFGGKKELDNGSLVKLPAKGATKNTCELPRFFQSCKFLACNCKKNQLLRR